VKVVAGKILVGTVFAVYPLLVWLGLAKQSPRTVALLMLGLVLPVALWLALRAPSSTMRWLLLGPIVTIVGLAVAACFDTAQFLFVEPIAISIAFLLLFGSTLRRGAMPMVERFARLQDPELSPPKQAWCRLWTVIWCAFFVANGSTALVLGLTAPLAWWAWYNSVLVYLVMGVLFATEWSLRQWKFFR
jgi:uncharacterized membrane protein